MRKEYVEAAVRDSNETDNSGTVPDNSDDGTKLRGTWGRKTEYLLSVLGYLVGLGNLWRFPYICMRNGGGAFLIPFFIFLIIFALPLAFLEMSIGQFTGKGFLHVWEVCPLFKGLGWGMMILSLTWVSYLNAILAWTLYYVVNSFTSQLPWTTCNNEWNSLNCVTDQGNLETVSNLSSLVDIFSSSQNVSFVQNQTLQATYITASEDFWQQNVLEISSGIHQIGHVNWKILLCFIAGWVIVGLCICKGVKSVGKVVYVTTLLPYLILTVILIRALMIDGSVDGVIKFLKPDFSKLLSYQIWIEAALQIFVSIGPGTGMIICMSSFNRFNNNFQRDSIFVTVASECTSILSGVVIYSVLGFMSVKQSIPIDKIVKSGPGLGFVVYPEALSYLPGQNVWAVFFFVMLLSVGLDSQFVMCESVIVGIKDSSRFWSKRGILLTVVFCTVMFLTGIIFCSQGGIYVYQLLDWYIAAFALPIMGFLECIIFSLIYGLTNFSNDVRLMTGRCIPVFYRICLGVITPLILLCLIISAIIGYQPPTYGSYQYPGYASIIGSIIASIPLIPIVVFMVIEVYKSPGSNIKEKVMHSLKPSKKWKPANKDFQNDYHFGFKDYTIMQNIRGSFMRNSKL